MVMFINFRPWGSMYLKSNVYPFLFFVLMTTFPSITQAKTTCANIKYKYKVKGKMTYFTKNLCKKVNGRSTLIFSKNCEQNNCHLIKKLIETKGKADKRIVGSQNFGSPQFLRCRSLDGRPEYVQLDPKFFKRKTMLCFSKVDDSILNTDAIYRWFAKKRPERKIRFKSKKIKPKSTSSNIAP